MAKKYSPVQIKNPSSIQHVARVQSGQAILLRLNHDLFPKAKLQLSDDKLLRIESESVDEQGTTYRICQSHRTVLWAWYSNVLLGDIWIDSDKQLARVIVMLECSTQAKKNFVTVINPDCADVRLVPGDILEAIVYDTEFEEKDEWVWQWCPQENGLKVDILGYDVLSAGQRYLADAKDDTHDRPYSKFSRLEWGMRYNCRQHHMWFRFDHTIMSYIHSHSGVNLVGSFQFVGWRNMYQKQALEPKEYHLSVYIDCDSKYHGRAMHSFMLPRREFLINGQQTQFPANTPYVVKTPKMKKHMGSLWLRDIKLNMLESKDLDSGCKTLSAEPQPVAHVGDGEGAFSLVDDEYPWGDPLERYSGPYLGRRNHLSHMPDHWD